jgi:predicted Zn-dependent peptidase
MALLCAQILSNRLFSVVRERKGLLYNVRIYCRTHTRTHTKANEMHRCRFRLP